MRFVPMGSAGLAEVWFGDELGSPIAIVAYS
jgi:hypothetical protein